MRRITLMADAAEAEAKAASSSTALVVTKPAVIIPEVEDMDLDSVPGEVADAVAGQAAEALKANPKGSFDWAQAIKTTTALKIKAKKDPQQTKGVKKETFALCYSMLVALCYSMLVLFFSFFLIYR